MEDLVKELESEALETLSKLKIKIDEAKKAEPPVISTELQNLSEIISNITTKTGLDTDYMLEQYYNSNCY